MRRPRGPRNARSVPLTIPNDTRSPPAPERVTTNTTWPTAEPDSDHVMAGCLAGVDPQHGEVAVDIGRGHGADGLATVGEGHQRLLASKVVGVRGDDAVAEHDPAAPSAASADAHDRRSDLRHHSGGRTRELFQHGHPGPPSRLLSASDSECSHDTAVGKQSG